MKLLIYRKLPFLLFILFCSHKSYAALNGVYTIDINSAASATNYKNVASFLSDLKEKKRTDGGPVNGIGVSGPVIVQLAPGTYTSQIGLSFIQGLSATNTLTLESKNGSFSNTLVTSYASNAGSSPTISISSFIKVKNISFSKYGTGTDATIAYISGDGASFEDCRFIGRIVTKKTDQSDLLICNFGGKAIIKNCTFLYGKHSIIDSYGNSYGEVEINGCTFDSAFEETILLRHFKNVNICQNVFNETASSTHAFVKIAKCDNVEIQSNRIVSKKGLYGIYLEDCKDTLTPILIANNVIALFKSNTNAIGISANYCSNVNFFHNTILTKSSSIAIYNYLENPKIIIQNNIFSSVNSQHYVIKSDYNIFLSQYNITYFQTRGNDKNSVVLDPKFNDDILFIPTNILIKQKGKAVSNVKKDILNVVRDSIAPDPGAYEIKATRTDIDLVSYWDLSQTCIGKKTYGVQMINKGYERLVNPKLYIAVHQNDFDSVFEYVILKNISYGDNASAEMQIPYTFKEGFFSVLIYAALPNDENRKNDTFKIKGYIFPEPPAIVFNDTVVCGNGKITINKNIAQEIKWYPNENTFYPIFTGNSFTTDYLFNDRDYYYSISSVFDTIISPNQNFLPDKAIIEAEIKIEAYMPSKLKSITVVPSKSGAFYFYLYYEDKYIATKKIDVSESEVNKPLTITTDFDLFTGIYFIRMHCAGVRYSIQNEKLNIIIPGLCSIQNSIGIVTWFSSINILAKGCESARKKLNIKIERYNAAIVINKNSNGMAYMGNEYKPDKVCIGSNLIYDIENYKMPKEGYGKNWSISNWKIFSDGVFLANDIQFRAGNAANWPAIIIAAKPGNLGKKVKLTVTLKNLQTGCDTTMDKWFYFQAQPSVNGIVKGDDNYCPGNYHLYSIPTFREDTVKAVIWDFGDGQIVSEHNHVLHKYNKGGKYSIKVTLLSAAGCTHTYNKQVNVFDVPDAGFTYSDLTKNRFRFETKDTLQGNIYQWKVNSKYITDERILEQNFSEGKHEIELLIKSKNGCENKSKMQLIVTPIDTMPKDTIIKDSTIILPELDPKIIVTTTLYPNPTSGVFTFQADMKYPVNKNKIILYDITGREILVLYQGNDPQGKFIFNGDISNCDLSPGVYFLVLYTFDQQLSENRLIYTP